MYTQTCTGANMFTQRYVSGGLPNTPVGVDFFFFYTSGEGGKYRSGCSEESMEDVF